MLAHGGSMNQQYLLHLLPDEASIDHDGALKIGDYYPHLLAKEWATPLYVYYASTVYRQVQQIRTLLRNYYPGKYEISYAGKAYLSLNFAKKLKRIGLTLDTVSLGEMQIAKLAGIPAEKVHLHGNNKSEEELRFALEWGVDNIVVDSLEELKFLEEIAANMNKVADIWLRITPGVDVETHPYVQTAHHASKFGLPISDGQASMAIQKAKVSNWVNLRGLHMHIGSQIFQVDPYVRALKTIMQLAESEKIVLEQISPGGGWGVPYTHDQVDIDVEEFVREIASVIIQECQRLSLPLPKLVVEPGRRLVARSCISVYQVGTIKNSSDGTRFISIDGGMADNPRPALYQSRYTAFALNRRNEALSHCAVVGKFCESGDQLIPDAMLPQMCRGDLIIIPVSGAYQLSMASNYNLAGRPAVLWLEDGKVELMQSRERIDQLDWWMGR
jgi:diaminopimelate decarboxylase